MVEFVVCLHERIHTPCFLATEAVSSFLTKAPRRRQLETWEGKSSTVSLAGEDWFRLPSKNRRVCREVLGLTRSRAQLYGGRGSDYSLEQIFVGH